MSIKRKISMRRKNIAILSAWNFIKNPSGEYFTNYTHWIYIDYLSQHFDDVYIITTVKCDINTEGLISLNCYNNLEIVDIPYSKNYISAQKNVFYYFRSIKKVSKKVDVFYCRTQDPFSWFPALIFRKPSIIHFVGDSIDAIRVNEKWNVLKKCLVIIGYLPDYFLTLIAAKKSMAYSNGVQISNKLKKYNIQVTPLVSSTILKSELLHKIPMPDNTIDKTLHLIYTGYLRSWKGINTLFDLIKLLKQNNIKFTFDILGAGEMYKDFESFIIKESLSHCVKLHGMVNNRHFINDIYRKSDIYVFPSLGGEGSPRSVIEAMAQGLIVISTPVGSLPTTFTDKIDIRFAKFNDAKSFYEIIKEFQSNRSLFQSQRENALKKVSEEFTRDIFLAKLFNVKS
jgi:glycosyltransferase involved in cell wall biosynthesis